MILLLLLLFHNAAAAAGDSWKGSRSCSWFREFKDDNGWELNGTIVADLNYLRKQSQNFWNVSALEECKMCCCWQTIRLRLFHSLLISTSPQPNLSMVLQMLDFKRLKSAQTNNIKLSTEFLCEKRLFCEFHTRQYPEICKGVECRVMRDCRIFISTRRLNNYPMLASKRKWLSI